MQSFRSLEGRVLAVSKTIQKIGISDRKEIYLLSKEKSVFRVTLWKPLSAIELSINDWVVLSRFQETQFMGRTLSSKSYSDCRVITGKTSEAFDLIRAADICGGFRIESIEELKTKVSPTTASFGFITGLLVSVDLSVHYKACSVCKKAISDQSVVCDTHCDSATLLAPKVSLYLECDAQIAKVTLFSESLRSLLATDVDRLVSGDAGREDLKQRLLSMEGVKICMRVKAERREYESDGQSIEFVQWTGQTPAFFIE